MSSVWLSRLTHNQPLVDLRGGNQRLAERRPETGNRRGLPSRAGVCNILKHPQLNGLANSQRDDRNTRFFGDIKHNEVRISAIP